MNLKQQFSLFTLLQCPFAVQIWLSCIVNMVGVKVVTILGGSSVLSTECVMSHMLVKSCVDHMATVIVQAGDFTIFVYSFFSSNTSLHLSLS